MNNKDQSILDVTAFYKDRTSKRVKGWTIKELKTLKTSQSETVTVEYKGKKVDVAAECDDLTPEDFRTKCEYVS